MSADPVLKLKSTVSWIPIVPVTVLCMARKGAGKSEVVDRTAIGKRAVVKVPVTTIGTRDDLVALIMETVAGKICNEG